ncbi:MAG TPA: ubiquinone biosynthesis hydroxylase [Afifellaceae bacterium]|nr:ubiquinone biosynthesis hydroxylase [Afifellaceae bacterium]
MTSASGGPKLTDIVIAGGGSAGLCAALALKRYASDLSVEVIDARPPAAGSGDQRASAIAAAARRMLHELGIWNQIEGEAQPILSMEVTDSKLSDTVRPVLLTFGGNVTEGEPFAHMVPNGALGAALKKAAVQAGVQLSAPQTVDGFSLADGHMELALGSGETRPCRLLVAADGVRSRLRGLAGIRTNSWSYPQIAIVVNVRHERSHEGIAVEHFLPSGPFAILPLAGNRSSLVWTEKKVEAQALLESDDFVFQTELERRFGHRLGRIEVEGPRQGYPLGLVLARDFVRPRFALLGDAAHGIHPIAGQGLNLGFRDVAALSETLVDAHRLGLDIGALDVLQRYERWRRFDTWQMGVTTDLLNRLFSNDLAPVRSVRDIGLGLVERMPSLKKMFIGEAAGFGSETPKLLEGEGL